MRFQISNFLLILTFSTSFTAIICGGLSLTGNKWLIDIYQNRAIGLNSRLGSFFSIGYTFQVIATALIGSIILARKFHKSFEQKRNILIAVLITIITLCIFGLTIMTLASFKFVAEHRRHIDQAASTATFKLYYFKSHSFIFFMINFFCITLVVGLIFFSLGYLSNEQGASGENEDSNSVINVYNLTPNQSMFVKRELTTEPVPDGIPAQPSLAEFMRKNMNKGQQLTYRL